MRLHWELCLVALWLSVRRRGPLPGAHHNDSSKVLRPSMTHKGAGSETASLIQTHSQDTILCSSNVVDKWIKMRVYQENAWLH
jgi:hypothetical protein